MCTHFFRSSANTGVILVESNILRYLIEVLGLRQLFDLGKLVPFSSPSDILQSFANYEEVPQVSRRSFSELEEYAERLYMKSKHVEFKMKCTEFDSSLYPTSSCFPGVEAPSSELRPARVYSSSGAGRQESATVRSNMQKTQS